MATIDTGRCPVCGGPLDGLRQIAGCVYSEPCGHRLYRGRLQNTDSPVRVPPPPAPVAVHAGRLGADPYWHLSERCRALRTGGVPVVRLGPAATRTLPASKRCPLCWPDGGPTPAQP